MLSFHRFYNYDCQFANFSPLYSQHLQKLKRKDGAPAAANETPTKKATAKKRTAAKVPAGEDDSDGEPDSPPKKKRAVGKKKAAAVPAAEEDKEEEEDVKASIKFEA